jgi:hypothetical protein
VRGGRATARLPRIESALGIRLAARRPHDSVAPTNTVPIVRSNAEHGRELVEAR